MKTAAALYLFELVIVLVGAAVLVFAGGGAAFGEAGVAPEIGAFLDLAF